MQRKERFDLRALYETSRLLGASLDLDFVLSNLLLTLLSKLFVTRGVVLLHDPVEDAYRTGAVKGISTLEKDEWVRWKRQPERDVVLREEKVPRILRERGITLLLPLVFDRREMGWLGLGSKATSEPFSSGELEFIQSLVHMSSAAIHNSLMVAELKQANRDLDAKIQELNTLFDLSREFNATLDREQIVKLLSFALMGQMLVRSYMLLLRPTERKGSLEVAATKGIEPVVLDEPLLESLCDLNRMVLLDDDEGGRWEALREEGIELILPLRHQGETCGVLGLGPKMTGQPYSPDDVEFLEALGNLAYVSIQNVYLIQEQIEKERLAKEIRLARQIQDRLLPQDLPAFEGLDVAARTRPSRMVGGDYYDVIDLGGGRGLVAVADVTGKGLPASLLMANLQACLHTLAPMDMSLEEATGHINRVICENTDPTTFITFFHTLYEPEEGCLRYVNAGHNPPIAIRADGTLHELEEGGLLLGVMSGAAYEAGRFEIEPGDCIALFTDGVTEAMSPEEELYGEERLTALLRKHREGAAELILEAVMEDVRRFTGDPEYWSDDVTLVLMKIDRVRD